MALNWTSAEREEGLKEFRPRRAAPGAWVPARAGDRLGDIDTPALILDLEKCDANIARLMKAVAGTGVRVRPQVNTHKCVQIARRQIAAGAIGVCCLKLGEAEAMLAAEVDDVLITNEIVGESKLRRLAQLAAAYAPARLGVCVDHIAVARQMAAACTAQRATVDIYIEVDVGQNRSGTSDVRAALELARYLHETEVFRFRGLHAYAGLAQHRRGVPERRAAAQAAAARAAATRDAILGAGLPCEIVCGGGTGTLPYDIESGVYNEIQPGSYVFMDGNYRRNEADTQAPNFDLALYLLASVTSVQDERATLDAGLKSFTTHVGPVQPAFGGWRVRTVLDEHTVLIRSDESTRLRLGDKTLLVPGHGGTTVNLHDWLVATRKGRVEAVWPIEARGRMY